MVALVDGADLNATLVSLTTALPIVMVGVVSFGVAGVAVGVDPSYLTPFNSPHSHHLLLVICVITTPTFVPEASITFPSPIYKPT
jgi:hypothetical protein